MWYKIVGAGLVAASLSACEDSTSPFYNPEADFAARLDANEEMAARVADLPVASASEVPLSGSATYEGYASIFVDTPQEITSLVGDAELTADFGDETIEGGVFDVVGTVDGGDVEALDGSLDVSDGDLGIATASGFGANLEGTLEGEDDTLEVDGSIFGNLRSDGDDDASALTAFSTGGTDFEVNGEDHTGLVTIVAED